MKKIPLILFVLSILFILFSLPSKAYAKTETSGDVQVTYDDPLFPPSIIWYPGLSVTKSFTVKNLGSSRHTVSLQATNTSQTGNIANVFLFKVTEGTNSRYAESDDKSLKNFWDAGQISLSDLNGGNTTVYDIVITMLTTAGNEYQGKRAVFDLIIGFVGTAAQVVITGGGAGAAAAGAAIAPICSDTPPSSAPTLTSAIPRVNSLTLIWTPAGDPVSYYLIAFGTTSGSYTYGNANVGGKTTTSYTVSGLSGGITYYFVVRAGNGCAPGPFSNELAAIPGGGFLAGLPPGFAPGVLGVATPSAELTPKATPSGEILGTTIPGEIQGEKAPLKCQTCLWWQILLGKAIVLFLYYFLLGPLIAILTYLVFLWLNNG